MVKIVLQPADDRAIILAPQVDQSSGQPANPSGPILTFAPHIGQVRSKCQNHKDH